MKLTTVVLVVLVFVAVFAGYWTAAASRATGSAPSPLFSYDQAGHYTYVATLTNNTLYNSTTITQGNGTLFTTITSWVNLTFTYLLTVDRSINASSLLTMTVAVQTPAWSKEIAAESAVGSVSGGTFETISLHYDLNVSNVSSLAQSVSKQTGYSAGFFVVVLSPIVTTSIGLSPDSTGTTFGSPLSFNFTSNQIEPSRRTERSASGEVQAIWAGRTTRPRPSRRASSPASARAVSTSRSPTRRRRRCSVGAMGPTKARSSPPLAPLATKRVPVVR